DYYCAVYMGSGIDVF
nr:immunoglobulin light chain junction region [Macaca mulatta]MOV73127.1 immunoglobulin light chain junction region [Macaca mulatta]MOV73243.1 immunoglobulin light chain junction region [Macaca mulatta]MOV73360.1 immunoglobulin light chain junction region [Macaca mulatta]MOV73375.1 immunoglobulin light chain junction region [Macaca mulatta]